MDFISAFSGIGGIDLGLERSGMRCVAQIEHDPQASAVLAHRFPGVPNFGDITKLDPARLPAADLVCGGFPCQDLSVAGKRAGLGGRRSGLFFDLARIIGVVAPRWLLLENVPGLLSSVCPGPDGEPIAVGSCPGGCMENHGGAMGTVLGTLAELGYGLAYRVLNAQYFGVAQRRERVFIVGCLGDAASAAKVLFEPESVQRDIEASRAARAGLTPCAEEGSGSGSGEGLVARALNTRSGRHYNETQDTMVLAGTLGDGSYGAGKPEELGHREPRWIQRKSLQVVHQRVRRLTPRETERLQGFPDDWTAVKDAKGRPMSDAARYRQTGNACAVPVIEAIGKRIMAVEEGRS